jgi:predicted ArsR family transcriptional regulator
MPADKDSTSPPGRRAEIWQILRHAAGPMSIVDLATQVGLHPNTVRFHLGTLVENGQVERVPPERGNMGRPPLLFRATQGMDPTGPRRYKLLAEVLIDALGGTVDARERAIRAGRAWGRQHGVNAERARGGRSKNPLARLVALLDGLGFAPELKRKARKAGGTRIELRHCPFLDLTGPGSAVRSEVVCSIHLGLMQGALQQWQAPVSVDRLDPFVEPNLCVAHLATVGRT